MIRGALIALVLLPVVVAGARAQSDVGGGFDRAVALYRRGDLPGALAAFEEVRAREPRDPIVRNWIGFILMRQERHAEAAKSLEEAVRLKPDYVEAWTNLGTACLIGLGAEDALRAFRRAAALAPRNASVRFNLGAAYARMKRNAEAAAEFREAARLNPEDGAAWNNLGYALQALRQLRDATNAFRKATEADPGNAAFWMNLGVALNEAGDPKRARAPLERAAKLDPRNVGALVALAEALIRLQNYDGALKHLEAAHTLSDKDFAVAYNLGLARWRKRDLAGAAAAYESARLLSPDNVETLTALVQLYPAVNRMSDALSVCAKLVELRPDDAAVRVTLGNLRAKSGDAAGAAAAWEDAAVRAPRRADIRLRLAEHYLEQANHAAAERHYGRILAAEPGNAAALHGMGLICDIRGRPRDAIGFYRRAVKANPRLATAHNNLGVALEKTGDLAGAKAEYRRALQIDPRFAEAERNLKRFDR